MGIGGFLKSIGGFFKSIFTGLIGVFVEDFEGVCERIVQILLSLDMSGSEKCRKALDALIIFAAIEGKNFINHAARMLIELELFKSKTGDDWQRLLEVALDMGLEFARQVVDEVEVAALVGDDRRRRVAADKLKQDLRVAGKVWLTDTVRMTETWVLNLLVEFAVAERKKIQLRGAE